MKLLLSIGLLLLAFHTHAQYSLKGQVIDGETNNPVAGSSVFIANTSLGVVSNKEGFFEITDIPNGMYRLVITNIAYETVTYDFSTDNKPALLKVLAQPKLVTMEPVVVGGYVKETWEKWGRTFTEYFIGRTQNAAKTSIKNHKVLHFKYYKNPSRLQVVADEPLIIENKAMGYQIAYQLENFEINFKEGSNFFSGYTLFNEMKGGSRQNKLWHQKRRLAYTGSQMHFFRSVYEGSLKEQGFEVRRVKKIRNTEKDRVREIYRINIGIIQKDSSTYYESVLQQKDFFYEYGAGLLTVDSFRVVQNNDIQVAWPDYLQIVHPAKYEEQGYLDQYGEKRSVYPARSIIKIQNSKALQLDANGNWFPAQELIAEWYWSWSEKVANMLPLNYKLDKN